MVIKLDNLICLYDVFSPQQPSIAIVYFWLLAKIVGRTLLHAL